MPGDADGSGAACVATPRTTRAHTGNVCVLGIYLLALHHSRGSLASRHSGSHFYGGNTAREPRRQTSVGVRTLLHRRVASAEAQRVSSHSAGACGRRVRAPAAHPQVGMAEGGEPAPPTSQTPSESLRPSEPVPPVEAQSAMQPLQPPVHPGQIVGAGSHAGELAGLLNLQRLRVASHSPP